MSAAEQPADDPITQMVRYGIALRSQADPPQAPWYATVLWAEEQGFFAPATGVRAAPLLVDLLVTALETEATRYRHAQREKTVEAGLQLLRGGVPGPVPAPVLTPPPPPVPLPKEGVPPSPPPAPPPHLLDGYAMAKYRRDMTLGSMTLDDWEAIRGRLRAGTLGQARLEAQVALVVQVAIAKGVGPHQPFREVMSDEEAAGALALAEEARAGVGEDVDQRIAHLVATSALFGH